MHAGETSITRHFAHEVGFAFALRQAHGEFGDDMPQAVNLLLPSDVTDGSARILDVFLTAQNLPDCLGLGTARIPHVDREDERVAAGLVVEYGLDRRVGKNPAVPIKLTVDRTAGKAGGSAPDAMT